MQVVVLPTPPFWLAIANTLAMRSLSLFQAAQYQQMTLALATGNLKHLAALQTEVCRQGLQFVVRLHALHGQPVRFGISQMARPVGKVLQRTEGPRTDAAERLLRLERFDAAVDNLQVGQLEFQFYLGKEAGFLAIRVEQGELPL